MIVLPVLLFIFGMLFILLGWRWQNPPSKEILIVLKGMAHLKREINRLEEIVKIIDKKVDNKAQGLTPESPEWRRIETKLLEISRPRKSELLPEIAKLLRENLIEDNRDTNRDTNRDANRTARDPRLAAYSKKDTAVEESEGQVFNAMNSENRNKEHNWDTLPEKYRRVLELAQYDFSVQEISKRLGISQDAVMMVARTHQRGGKA
ncbi:MAG: sigma factor-like helix-turn-helix DNA-binding protein [Desulfitobacteriaceae bacterium]